MLSNSERGEWGFFCGVGGGGETENEGAERQESELGRATAFHCRGF